MHRFLRILMIFIAALLILVGLGAAYLLSGTSSAQTRAHYTITLPDPSAKTLTVTLTLQPGPAPFLDLFLREPVQDGRQRVTGFTAERNGQPVAHWQALPIFPDVVRLWNGFSSEPVTIHYQVDPLWMKGAESPRSYLGADFAYIRGMVTLYTPLSVNEILHLSFDHPGTDAGFAEAEVSLPSGWKMVSPFGEEKIATPIANLRNSYIGLGPFDVQNLTIAGTPFLLGVYEGLPPDHRDTLNRQIPILFETMQKETRFSPISDTCYWSLVILPTEPIHGGASGTGSLVVEDNLNIIAHEMFHWWNGSSLVTTPDANWLKEGFTTYYSAKTLYTSGLWTNEDFSQQIGRYLSSFRRNAAAHGVNLMDASNQLVRQNSPNAYDQVYYGGALLAFHLDRQLKAQGKSLDAIWPALNDLHRPVSTQDFLQVLENTGGADLARQTGEILRGQQILEIQPSGGE